jgi:hypothetical protein
MSRPYHHEEKTRLRHQIPDLAKHKPMQRNISTMERTEEERNRRTAPAGAMSALASTHLQLLVVQLHVDRCHLDQIYRGQISSFEALDAMEDGEAALAMAGSSCHCWLPSPAAVRARRWSHPSHPIEEGRAREHF